jgi:glucose-6-phosphate isomerase
MALHVDLTAIFGSAAALPRLRENLARGVAARDAHLAAEPAWRTLHEDRAVLEACRTRANEVLGSGVEHIVVLGIGGSALGASAMNAALGPLFPAWERGGGAQLHVLDNPDPELLGTFFEQVPIERTHFNVISKSGGTLETSAEFLLAWQAVRRMESSDDRARARFTLTTDPAGGHFRALADSEGFQTLPVPPGVGGRFSVLSPVGLFPAAAAGFDVESLLEGAAKTDRNLRAAAPEEDPALMWALAHVLHMEAGRSIHVHFPYAHRLRLLADWYAQLWAESLGKRHNLAGEEVHVGPTPVRAVGPTDQHSQMQLYAEGPDDKVYTFLKLRDFARKVPVPHPFADSPAFTHLRGRELGELVEAERQGTEVALRQAGRPLCVIEMCGIDAFHVGQYFQFMEVATALAGGMMGIDPFDQPGVESGKIAALALMGCEGYEDRADEIRAALQDGESLQLKC